MENRKLLKLSIPILLGLFFIFPKAALAYGPETHAYLTDETVNFYNKQTLVGKISPDLKAFLLDGSRREDDIPRFMNHFYDPINNRGITTDAAITPLLPVGSWQATKYWAEDSANQNSPIYKVPATIASILTAIDQKKISVISSETNFTWSKAIDLYASGKNEEAMFALGHVLHLMEDMSVPDHTRNDAHIVDSPYELYTDRFVLNQPDQFLSMKLSGKQLLAMDNLGVLFDGLAVYSNNNFYSKDTIGIQSGYNLPQPDYFQLCDGFLCGIFKDEDNNVYYLMLKKSISGNVVTMNVADASIDNIFIKQDYWSLLSSKAVQYSASVISLFFKEAQAAREAYKLNPVPIEKKTSFFGQLINSAADWFSSISNAGKDAFSRMFGGFSQSEVIGDFSLNPDDSINNQEETPTEPRERPSISVSKLQIKKGEENLLKGSKFTIGSKINIYIERPDKIKVDVLVTSDIGGNIAYKYLATDYDPLGIYYVSAKDSVTGLTTDKIKFELLEPILEEKDKEVEVDKDSEINKKPAKPEDQSTDNFQLCDFNAGTSVLQKIIFNEIAWMGSTASASSEWIELKNISGETIDISGWQIIDKESHIKIRFSENTRFIAGGFYLLERTDDASVSGVTADLIYTGALSNSDEGLKLFDNSCNVVDLALAEKEWSAGDATSRKTMERDATGFGWHTSSFVDGTPKQENSVNPYPWSSGGGGSNTPSSPPPASTVTPCDQNTSASPNQKVLINEVAWAGNAVSSSAEWIELKNTTDSIISLAGWQLLDKTEDIKIVFAATDNIPAGEFYLLERGSENFITGVTADKFYSGAINNSDETLKLFNNECGLIDAVIDVGTNWSNISGSSGPEYRTAERSDINSWHTYNGGGANGINGTPKAENSISGEGGDNSNDEVISPLADHVVISEIMAGKEGFPEDEFIELYNPTNQSVVLDGWELRKKVVSSGNEVNLLDSDTFFGTISPKGFFLIGHANYSGEKQVDLRYSTVNDLAYSDNAVVLYNADHELGSVVDEVVYNEIEKNKSTERKAWKNGVCVLASSEEGEFLGNGCDNNDFFETFSLREVPNPQNTSSLLEPREAPAALTVADWQINYNFDKASIDFTLPASDSVSYRILDIVDEEITDSGPITIGVFSKHIDEIGRNHRYQVKVMDKDGLLSPESDIKETNIPSYIRDFYFYKASHYTFQGTEADEPLIEFSYDVYPFMSRDVNLTSVYGEPAAPNYKIMVLYLNMEAPKDLFLDGDSPLSVNLENVLKIKYNTCSGGSGERSSLVMADVTEGCNIFIGNIPNGAIAFNTYLSEADNHLLLPTIRPAGDNNFTSDDFVTIAFYSLYRFYPQGFSSRDIFKLLAVDKQKYYFNALPVHQPPIMSGEINTTFDSIKSELTWTVPPASDLDTVDSLLRYEISYDGGLTWENGSIENKKIISPGEIHNLQIRAIDDFGLKSEPLQVDYTALETAAPFGISGLSWRNDTGSSKNILSFNYQNYPFMTGSSSFKAMLFYFNRLPPESYNGKYSGGDYSKLQIKHFSCADFVPGSESNVLRDFPILILADSSESVRDSFGSNTTDPNRCFTWTGLPKSSAFVPVPASIPGEISLEVSGILNSDKTLESLTSSDFFTIGFYEFDPYHNGILLANDSHKYYFQP
jgi:hypothetical protein